MNEFQEKRQIFKEERPIKQAVPVVTHPVGDTEYKSVVHERRGVSGVAIAALVMAAIAVAVLITMLVMNNQQRARDDELAQMRAQASVAQPASQQAPGQTSQQSPAVMPVPSAPATTSAPAPSESQPATAPPARSNVEIELDITARFVDDPELRSYPIDVKVDEGIATLSGELPKETLKAQAEKLARRVKGVQRIINNITVQAQPGG